MTNVKVRVRFVEKPAPYFNTGVRSASTGLKAAGDHLFSVRGSNPVILPGLESEDKAAASAVGMVHTTLALLYFRKQVNQDYRTAKIFEASKIGILNPSLPSELITMGHILEGWDMPEYREFLGLDPWQLAELSKKPVPTLPSSRFGFIDTRETFPSFLESLVSAVRSGKEFDPSILQNFAPYLSNYFIGLPVEASAGLEFRNPRNPIDYEANFRAFPSADHVFRPEILELRFPLPKKYRRSLNPETALAFDFSPKIEFLGKASAFSISEQNAALIKARNINEGPEYNPYFGVDPFVSIALDAGEGVLYCFTSPDFKQYNPSIVIRELSGHKYRILVNDQGQAVAIEEVAKGLLSVAEFTAPEANRQIIEIANNRVGEKSDLWAFEYAVTALIHLTGIEGVIRLLQSFSISNEQKHALVMATAIKADRYLLQNYNPGSNVTRNEYTETEKALLFDAIKSKDLPADCQFGLMRHLASVKDQRVLPIIIDHLQQGEDADSAQYFIPYLTDDQSFKKLYSNEEARSFLRKHDRFMYYNPVLAWVLDPYLVNFRQQAVRTADQSRVRLI